MSGVETYSNTWMGATFKEFWLNTPGDTGITGPHVSDYLTQIYNRLKAGCKVDYFLAAGGPFNGLTVETWRIDRPDCGNIKNYAGLTYNPQPLIQIAHPYATPSCYSHEMGHRISFTGRAELWPLYRALRGADFTDRTPEQERIAEDMKWFFGADGVALVLDPNDDAAHPELVGRQVRWAKDVAGLENMLRGWWPVSFWLGAIAFSRLTWGKQGFYQWLRDGRVWEAWSAGYFFWHDGKTWIAY